MEEINLEHWLETATAYLASTGPIEWGIGGGGLLVILLLISISAGRRRKKRNARAIAPNLSISAFQLSPMGRDAFFKVHNHGDLARLSTLVIKGKGHIQVKNNIAGHEIKNGDSYRILLEATGSKKINKDFIVELTYLDQSGNVYRQDFPIARSTAEQPKLIKFA